MKKFLFVIFIVMPITYFIFWQNNLFNPFWGRLTSQIHSGSREVYFSEITNFPWDTVCILEAYSLGARKDRREQRASEFINGELGEFRNRLPHMNSDGQWAFVFISDGIVVDIREKGNGYSLRKAYSDNCISQERARFIVSGEQLKLSD